MTIIYTPRLCLEPVNYSHFNALHALNNDPTVMRYISKHPVSVKQTLCNLEWQMHGHQFLGLSAFSIFDLDTDEFIGSVSIQHIESNQRFPIEIGWRLVPSSWGRGFATEAVRSVISHFFDTTTHDCLRAVCDPKNAASERVMRRLGMQYIGRERWYGLEVNGYRVTQQSWQASTTQCTGNNTKFSQFPQQIAA